MIVSLIIFIDLIDRKEGTIVTGIIFGLDLTFIIVTSGNYESNTLINIYKSSIY